MKRKSTLNKKNPWENGGHGFFWNMFPALNFFRSVDFDGKTGFGRFWPKQLVFVDFGRHGWFWSNLAGKTGYGQFWPKKSWFWSIDRSADKTRFGRFWPENLVLVDKLNLCWKPSQQFLPFFIASKIFYSVNFFIALNFL